ncbi:Six-hairpin glycosidase-like protein [Mycena floridula]|nr:Six-hairpin glycosidase-like protein [Mycena floridula]
MGPFISLLFLIQLSFTKSLGDTRARDDFNDPFPFDPGFDIQSVASLAVSLPSHSWEFGTASEALLELYNPEISVFGRNPFPIRRTTTRIPSLVYAANKIVLGTGANVLSDGDGAVGDPCSLGVSAVLLGKSNRTFADAALRQAQYVVEEAPRFWNGAISHRVAYPELWADFIYMAPPFLAYLAVDTSNRTLLEMTVEQCGLYRQILLSNSTGSVWEHIIGPVNMDPGLWSTGNAWATAGMTRVLATVMKSDLLPHGTQRAAVENLVTWIKEILDGVIAAPDDNGLVRNYLYDTMTVWFGETSGSALFAAVAYRMLVLAPEQFGTKYFHWAEGIRRVLGNGHVTKNGTATPAVNPLGWGDTTPYTAGSPEGQNFLVIMYAAWRDCIRAERCFLNKGSST